MFFIGNDKSNIMAVDKRIHNNELIATMLCKNEPRYYIWDKLSLENLEHPC